MSHGGFAHLISESHYDVYRILIEAHQFNKKLSPQRETQCPTILRHGRGHGRDKLWLPIYLRRSVFVAFTVVFGAMIVALEVLFSISNENHGLANGYSGMRHLWTYGPTTVLTLTRAVWYRVDYEAKITAPWLRAGPICSSKYALLLDYIDMNSMIVPLQAFRRRDYRVAASTTISILLGILITLSTGLFTLSPVEFPAMSVPITLKGRFVDDPARFMHPSGLPFDSIDSLADNTSTYPDGVSDSFAYQTFVSDLPGVSELRATVDGMFFQLNCTQATVSLFRGGELFISDINTVSWSSEIYVQHGQCLFPVQCNSTSLGDKSLLLVSAELLYKVVKQWRTTEKDTNFSGTMFEFETTTMQSTSLDCFPSYGIALVDVVQNATGMKSISRNADYTPRKLSSIHPWDFVQDEEPHSSNATFFETILSDYFHKYASFHSQQTLVESVDLESTAVASITVDRLLVQPLACQWMTAILVIGTVLLLGLAIKPSEATAGLTTPAMMRFPRVLGAMDAKALKRDTERWCSQLPIQYNDDQNDDIQKGKALRKFIRTAKLNLWPFRRIIVYTLIRSNLDQGLGTIQDEKYLHYLWTILPALFLSTLSLFFSSVDSNTRILAPYYSLRRVASIDVTLDLNLLRPLMPQALYQQIRTHSFATFSTSIAFLVSSVLTISIGSLYQPTSFSMSNAVELQTTSTFPTVLNASDFEDIHMMSNYSTISSIILENNVSYTPLVYENLILPNLSLESYIPTNVSETPEQYYIRINVTIPALRPRLFCRLYPDSDITASFFYNQTFAPYRDNAWTSDGITIKINGEACVWNNTSVSFYLLPNSTASIAMDLLKENSFAASSYTKGKAAIGCSHFLYVWGRLSHLTQPPSISTWALGCNSTIETVDVVASFIGPNLRLDPAHPPQAIESTSNLIPVDGDVANPIGGYTFDNISTMDSGKLYNISSTIYMGLTSLPPYSNKTLFDPFFEQLVTSRYAIPVAAIGDPSQVEAVRNAITFQHGIIAAQYYDQFRVDSRGPNGTMNPIFPSLSNTSATGDTGVYYGTATDPQGRRRLVQDPTSTRVIQALLATTLVFSLLGWLLGPRKDVLPRSPTSVASVLALLAGGNVLEYMYKDGDVHWTTIEEVKAVFPDDCKFWMGWGPPGTPEEDPERRFGIWMVTKD
ncbi:hypothetical protein GGR52DRAFT_587311 [Hypoxylon sp. FL1284]|nr:hypothetical protein GGR52DRAFT_587311 [Hypoxylon sp. FL1284]